MTRIFDVVNFNADASCLAAEEWLSILAGARRSKLYRWLALYVELQRPVVLGIVGAAIADIARFNPDAIALINANPAIFGIVLRPFSHDVGLLRSKRGFTINFMLGRAITRREFPGMLDYFLPPEFMLTNSQVKILAESGVLGTFVNPTRFSEEIRERLPTVPFQIEGVLGSRIPCIPFAGSLTRSYLESMHNLDSKRWAEAVASQNQPQVFIWRDGESCFLVPDGIERERHWLAGEDASIQRQLLPAAINDLSAIPQNPERSVLLSYPVHSFTAWFKEFRMLGYLNRLAYIEENLDSLSQDQIVTWLQAINSDVLSAIEKESPVVTLAPIEGHIQEEKTHTIWRSQRGFEGEDYLALLELSMDSQIDFENMLAKDRAHIVKLRARVEYVRGMKAILPS